PEGILELMVGSSTIAEVAFSLPVGTASSPIYDADITKNVGYWLIKVLERKAETNEAHVQALLLGNRLEAETVRARIEGGEDINAVAKEVSRLESKENGADVGWVTRDIAGKVFGDYAFDTSVPINTLSQPLRETAVTTKGGYWLVRVVAQQADRPIDKDTRELLKTRAFTKWLGEREQGPASIIELLLDESQMLWALSTALKNISVTPR
ncbi:MAG: peptidylprolyl isomerase, partial [Chloroflexota bacterium]